jgi:hypothetical protein
MNNELERMRKKADVASFILPGFSWRTEENCEGSHSSHYLGCDSNRTLLNTSQSSQYPDCNSNATPPKYKSE